MALFSTRWMVPMSLQPNGMKIKIKVDRTVKNQGPSHAHGTHSAATLSFTTSNPKVTITRNSLPPINQ